MSTTDAVFVVIIVMSNLITVGALSFQVWVRMRNRRDMSSLQEKLPTGRNEVPPTRSRDAGQ